MAFKEGVVLGIIDLNATGSGTTHIGASSNSGAITIGNTSSGAVTIDCGAAGMSVGATATNHISTFGSNHGTSATTLQSGTGNLQVIATNGALSVNSGTGTLDLSSDSVNTTITLGGGAGIKNITLGSTNTSSKTIVQAGSAGIVLSGRTAYAPICGGVSTTDPIQSADSGISNSGYILTSTGSGSLPTWQSNSASAITITGDTGGGLMGNSFTFKGGTTGLSFGGSGTTETLTFAGITANGGTVSLATDATTSTLNIGTGAGAKTTNIGSTSSTSSTSINSGSGAITLTTSSGNADIILAPNGTGVVSTINNVYAAGISFDSGTNVLANYVDATSWTPTLTFGGGSTGITYTTRVGYYSRIGNVITANAYIQLSSNGSSTGTALISGLSFVPSTTYVPVNFRWINVSYTGILDGYYDGTYIRPEEMSTGGSRTALADTNFANNAAVMMTLVFVI